MVGDAVVKVAVVIALVTDKAVDVTTAVAFAVIVIGANVVA